MSTPSSKPPEPDRETKPRAEVPGSPLRAILTGLAIDIGGTTLIQIVLTTLYAMRLAQSGSTPYQVRDVLRQLPPQSALALLFPLLGSLCSVAGGYACARIVRRDEFRIGAVMAVLSAGLGLLTGDDGGPDDLVVLFTLCTAACVMLGVKYGRERNQRLDAVLAAPAADDGPAPMIARRVAIGIGVALTLGVLAWWAFTAFAPRAFIEIDQAQLQARLDARFPQKNCTLMVACVTLSAPAVALSEGSNRIGLSADVLVTLGKRVMPGKVAFSGVLRYVRYEGDFYLDDVQVDKFSLTGFPPELVQVVKVRGPAAMRRALEGHPIYTLKGAGKSSALAKLAVRDVQVVNGRVRVTFLRFGG